MSQPSAGGEAQTREFHLTVMGRTLEHLGVQMYKRRDTALAELVANCWDAGATEVHITIPEPGTYDPDADEIRLEDDGIGMDDEAVEDQYLVVGRNRRQEGGAAAPRDRVPMGRKGIGKLAGFGLAQRMRVDTWTEGDGTTSLELDVARLKQRPGKAETVPIEGR